MKLIVYFVTLFWGFIFFSATSILGVAYNGSEDSKLFIISSLIIVALFYIYYINDKQKGEFNKGRIGSFLLYIFIILAEGVISGYTDSSMFKQFTLFCVPASLLGIKYAKKGTIAPLVKYLDCLVVILSFSFVFMMSNLAQLVGDGLAGYSQQMSYFASLTILLNVFLIKYGRFYDRFKIFTSKAYRIISYLLLLPQLLALVMGGGRGAFIVFFVGLLFLVIKDLKKIAHAVIRVSFIVIVVLAIIPRFNYFGIEGAADVVSRNFERIIAVGKAGEDLYDRTSGRNYVYKDAIYSIEKNPLGYGMFSFEKQLPDQPYPHNIILEWAMQWGVLYALFQIVLIFFLFKHYKRWLLKDRSLIILLPILTYQFILLLFSGSYMQEPLYWFSITFLLNFKYKRKGINKINTLPA